MSGWGYALMAISMVLFWGLVIFAVVALVRFLGNAGRGHGGHGSSDPERLLAERYARGEIDDEEYRTRLETLRERQASGR